MTATPGIFEDIAFMSVKTARQHFCATGLQINPPSYLVTPGSTKSFGSHLQQKFKTMKVITDNIYIFCTEADFVPCFAAFSLRLGGVGLHCGRSWIRLLAGIIEWAVKMIKDSSNILPLGDKW